MGREQEAREQAGGRSSEPPAMWNLKGSTRALCPASAVQHGAGSSSAAVDDRCAASSGSLDDRLAAGMADDTLAELNKFGKPGKRGRARGSMACGGARGSVAGAGTDGPAASGCARGSVLGGAQCQSQVNLEERNLAALPPALISALMTNTARLLQRLNSWDANGDGTISQTELERACITLGLPGLDENGVAQLFEVLDVDKDGEIRFTEILALKAALHDLMRRGRASILQVERQQLSGRCVRCVRCVTRVTRVTCVTCVTYGTYVTGREPVAPGAVRYLR